MDNALIYFIQKLLLDMSSINFNYFKAPYVDVSSIDVGLRKGLKHSEKLYDSFIKLMSSVGDNCFYFYSDGFLLNYILFHPHENDDVIVVGPYLKSNIDEEYFNYIIEKHHLNHNELESIRGLLYQFPIYDDSIKLTSILVNIVSYIRPGVSFTTSDLNKTYEEDLLYTPIDQYMLNAQATVNRYNLEEPLLQAISRGDTSEALSITRHFLSMLYKPRIDDATIDKKASLYSTNTLLRIGAGRSDVHPVFLHELSSKFVKLINTNNNIHLLNDIHENMVKEYCLLVKNKSRSGYSKTVSDALDYIDINLSQQLSLSVLADYLHISPPYLSKTFKKEMDMTITAYITQLRIHTSLKLLNTTNMQVQEIASYVGIHDYNYYTKTFKKIIGLTPRAYRNQVKQDT